jgi:hypothetical protein
MLASVLLIHAFASPWLETKNIGAQMVSMKHGLEAMAADKELVQQILDRHAQRNPDLRQREAQDIENVARSFVGDIGTVIDGVIGGLLRHRSRRRGQYLGGGGISCREYVGL